MAGNKLKNNKNKNDSGKRRNGRNNPAISTNLVRPKMHVNFDGQFLNGTQFMSPALTVANTAAGLYPLDASSTNAVAAGLVIQSTAAGLNVVTSLYNEYIYRAATFHWIPFVSPGVADAGSQIYVGYVDNTEEMATLTGTLPAAIFNVSKAIKNMKFFNAWERFSYTVPITNRRKTFDVNTNTALGNVDIYDRSMQGMVVMGANSLSAAVSLGQWRVVYTLELRRMNFAQVT